MAPVFGSPRAFSSLPPEIVGRAAFWLTPSEFLCLNQCATRLVGPEQLQELLRAFCVDADFARPVSSQPFAWSEVRVDWDTCLRLNLATNAAGVRGTLARVRIGQDDIWVPRPSQLASDREPTSKATFDLAQVVQRLCIRQVGMPLRLREFICDRPGVVVQKPVFVTEDGPASFLVELPCGLDDDDSWVWALPPYRTNRNSKVNKRKSPSDDIELEDGSFRRSVTCSESMPSWSWRRSLHLGVGRLAAMRLCASTTANRTLPDSAPVESRPQGRSNGFLVELVVSSSASPRQFVPPQQVSKWVHVGADVRAEDLTLAQLAAAIWEYLPGLGIEQVGLAGVLPASAKDPCAGPHMEARPSWHLLSDLRWTQAERLILSEITIKASENPWAEDESRNDSSVAASWVRAVGPEADMQRVVVFWRDTARPPLMDAPSSSSKGRWDPSIDSQARPHPGVPEDQKPPVVRLGGSAWWQAGAQVEEKPLSAKVAHSRREMLVSSAVRQFEFHPTVPGLIIAGRKDGKVMVLDYEKDERMQALHVDNFPVLGLSWLQSQPQWAVVGTSQSGSLRLVKYDGGSHPMTSHRLENFNHLSSLSVNCTDDFLTTSGFCIDIGLYDVARGSRISTFHGLHQNFTNTTRFAHRSPHLFVTASFDHTCKLWDLRQPVSAGRAAAVFKTDTMNVMCTFSPDDSRVLCSGVDSALQQFSVAGAGRGTLPPEVPSQHRNTASSSQPGARGPPGKRFPLQPLNDESNYRRSLYLATGGMVATAGTQERCIRFYSANAPHAHQGRLDLGELLGRKRIVEEATPESLYVQSLRCHPRDPRLLGVLVSSQSESSVVLVRLENA